MPNTSSDSSWLFASWFARCCACVVGDLECICIKVSRDLPTLVLVPGAYSKTKRWKQTNSSTGFKNQGVPKIY